MSFEPEKIRITPEDLAQIRPEASPVSSAAGAVQSVAEPGQRQWGSIAEDATLAQPGTPAGLGSFFLKGWVYLGLAGLLAALLAWGLCEPFFLDRDEIRGEHAFEWRYVGNVIMFPLLVTFMSVAFAVVESLVERSTQKALSRGGIALLLGLVLGVVFIFGAGIILHIGKLIIRNAGGIDAAQNPAFWMVRASAWLTFGLSAGLVYGIAGQSGKKCVYGVVGGAIGAGLGGLLFDPISLLTYSLLPHSAAPSRVIGMGIFGLCTGVALGLVESALKDRWLYVAGGPLAGKQFILYKPVTQLGSQQTNEIYLFKDTSIAPVHAVIELRGPLTILRSPGGATYVSGQPVRERVLRSGEAIQIGRYTFLYQEKQASA